MTKKIRQIILAFCAVCFFSIAPVLVAYSMGYRFDFDSFKVVSTGGIYVRTFPAPENVVVDSKISMKPGMFSNAVFIQSLVPQDHTVLVQRQGYNDYYKTLAILEGHVTKIENILLIKKALEYSRLSDYTEFFSIAPDGQTVLSAGQGPNFTGFSIFRLNDTNNRQEISFPAKAQIIEAKWSSNSAYAIVKAKDAKNTFYFMLSPSESEAGSDIFKLLYLDKNSQEIQFDPTNFSRIFYKEGQTIYALLDGKSNVFLKGALTYQTMGNGLLWLSSQGLLIESDSLGNIITTLSKTDFEIDPSKKYKISIVNGHVFLSDGSLNWLFNMESGSFEPFEIPQGSYEIINAPDSKNLIFWNSKKIYLYSLEEKKYAELFSGEVATCQWINNDYIIFQSGKNIAVSEIDYRGNINAVNLPDIENLGKMQYVPQLGRVYLISGTKLDYSEKITP